MPWLNADGLYVKFGTEEAARQNGGEYLSLTEGSGVWEFDIRAAEIQSATAVILGSNGAAGFQLPKGIVVEQIEVVVDTAFTSSGTIAAATLVVGLIREDRTTAYDDDGLLAATFVGTNLNTVGKKTTVVQGSTGAGALVGTTLPNAGWITIANSTHATNPFTAGKGKVRIKGYVPKAA